MGKKDPKHEMSKMMDQLKTGWEKLSKDIGSWAAKSEKEIVKASKIGKLDFDIMGLGLKKEKIFHQIGKKLHELKGEPEKWSDAINQFMNEINKIEKEVKSKKREISSIRKVKSAK